MAGTHHAPLVPVRAELVGAAHRRYGGDPGAGPGAQRLGGHSLVCRAERLARRTRPRGRDRARRGSRFQRCTGRALSCTGMSMSRTEQWDAIVVGGGQAGPALAVRLAQAGHRTALVERHRVGGTCVHTGCTPTKTLVASARVAAMARRADEFG